MKRILTYLFISTLILLPSCTPLVTTNLEQSIPHSGTDESIKVFGLNSEIPVDAEVLGTIKIGDTGFTATKNCTFQDVLNSAKGEAKKVGGNAIKIIDHIPPGTSTCHRITAKILRLCDIKPSIYQEVGSLSSNYAILNIFCEPDTIKIDYDLHLGDSVICSINNNLKTTIAVRKRGLNTIWAQVDKRTEIQINIEFGKAYYLKCDLLSVDTGKQPSIELVDPKDGDHMFGVFGLSNNQTP